MQSFLLFVCLFPLLPPREPVFLSPQLKKLVYISAQAIVSIKKGAYLLKCGRRGKPKLCPFRLSPVSMYINFPYGSHFLAHFVSSNFLYEY